MDCLYSRSSPIGDGRLAQIPTGTFSHYEMRERDAWGPKERSDPVAPGNWIGGAEKKNTKGEVCVIMRWTQSSHHLKRSYCVIVCIGMEKATLQVLRWIQFYCRKVKFIKLFCVIWQTGVNCNCGHKHTIRFDERFCFAWPPYTHNLCSSQHLKLKYFCNVCCERANCSCSFRLTESYWIIQKVAEGNFPFGFNTCCFLPNKSVYLVFYWLL